MNHFKSAVISIVAAITLAACGGGDSPSTTAVVASGTALPINAVTGSTLAANLQGTTFNYASGIPALGVTGATALALSNDGQGGTAFSLSSGGNTASGPLGYGSCIFTVTKSTFPAGHPLATGQTQKIDPCSITLNSNATADGTAKPVDVKLVVGNSVPTNVTSLTIAVNPSTGVVTLVTPGGQAIQLPITVAPSFLTGGSGLTGAVSAK